MTPRRDELVYWRVTKPLRSAIAAGHPWIYDRAVRSTAVRPGSVVVLVDERGPLATAFGDPGSPIRARVLAGPDARIDGAWVSERCRLASAVRARDPLLVGCSGRRLVHGEADRCPGLVVDCYDDTAVVVFDGEAAAGFWQPYLDDVFDGLEAGGHRIAHAVVRGDRRRRGQAINARGQPGDQVIIEEDEARFVVDIRTGQKTGFFLDQRDNRRSIRRHAGGARVLNLFSYTGGFSLHAALGGATHVTSVDVAAIAAAAIERNVGLSGLPWSSHQPVVADAFDFIAQAKDRNRTWDLVIADPPSFAPSERAKPAALAAYKKLAHACLAVVAPEGRFALASCSSHISEHDLLGIAPDARIRLIGGAASDHPVRPHFPEGRYLKFLLFDVG